MATSDKTNVITRAEKTSPLTYNEMDNSFLELKAVIDDATSNENAIMAIDNAISGSGGVDERLSGVENSLSNYLTKSQNLNDLPNKPLARLNLNVYSQDESNSRFLQTGDLTDIDARVNTNADDIQTNLGFINGNSASISNLSGRITANDSDISNLSSRISSNDSDISSLQSASLYYNETETFWGNSGDFYYDSFGDFDFFATSSYVVRIGNNVTVTVPKGYHNGTSVATSGVVIPSWARPNFTMDTIYGLGNQNSDNNTIAPVICKMQVLTGGQVRFRFYSASTGNPVNSGGTTHDNATISYNIN